MVAYVRTDVDGGRNFSQMGRSNARITFTNLGYFSWKLRLHRTQPQQHKKQKAKNQHFFVPRQRFLKKVKKKKKGDGAQRKFKRNFVIGQSFLKLERQVFLFYFFKQRGSAVVPLSLFHQKAVFFC